MRSLLQQVFLCLGLVSLLTTCVDPQAPDQLGTLDVVVVDGSITDLAEPQLIRLSRAQTDPLTGRPGNTPLTNASVAIIEDSTRVLTGQQTLPGTYQLPDGFRGRAGHAYQLRFTLSDGAAYLSTVEYLQPVAAIGQIRAEFNANSLTSTQRLNNVYTAAHDFYVDFTDPAEQANYYRWEWVDWERQDWCRSCSRGLYQIQDDKGNLIEDCVNYNFNSSYPPHYDYNCRTACWEVIYGNDLVLFSDRFSNGNPVKALRVAQVPLYSKEHCLVEIRQTSLTQQAYQYYYRLQEQTQQAGGVASGQPALLVGNVTNQAQRNEPVIGYFTASGVSTRRYWLTRSDAAGRAPGLFQALNGRDPVNESGMGRNRPPLAVCLESESSTAMKPAGWQD